MITEEFWLRAKAGVKEDPQYLSCPVGAWERRRLSSQIHGVHRQVNSFRSLCVSVVGIKSSRVRDGDRPCIHEGCYPASPKYSVDKSLHHCLWDVLRNEGQSWGLIPALPVFASAALPCHGWTRLTVDILRPTPGSALGGWKEQGVWERNCT